MLDGEDAFAEDFPRASPTTPTTPMSSERKRSCCSMFRCNPLHEYENSDPLRTLGGGGHERQIHSYDTEMLVEFGVCNICLKGTVFASRFTWVQLASVLAVFLVVLVVTSFVDFEARSDTISQLEVYMTTQFAALSSLVTFLLALFVSLSLSRVCHSHSLLFLSLCVCPQLTASVAQGGGLCERLALAPSGPASTTSWSCCPRSSRITHSTLPPVGRHQQYAGRYCAGRWRRTHCCTLQLERPGARVSAI